MKNFTNNFKQFTSRLSARWLIMAQMLLLGTSSAWAWYYKSSGGSWNDCTSGFTTQAYYPSPTENSSSSISIIMKENPGSGFNVGQDDHCDDNKQKLYVALKGTASSSKSTIVRATAQWNNGLYSLYTVVIPDGKIYIKPNGGTAIEMTKSSYSYTAELELSSDKKFDLYAVDPEATITAQNSMPSAGKPTSVRLNYTNLVSDYQYVRVTYNLETNQITFEEMTPPCDKPDAPIFGTNGVEVCEGTQVTLPTIAGVTLKWYDENNQETTETFKATENKTYYAVVVGDCESDKTSYTITIKTKPTVTLNPNENTVCTDVTLGDITDYVEIESTESSQISWYAADQGGDPLASNTALEVASYFAEATLNGCSSDRAEFTIKGVLSAPTEVPDVTAPESICDGESAVLELNNKDANYTYKVNEVEVDFTNNKYTVSPQETASYTIKAENKCGYKETTISITVNQKPSIGSITQNVALPVPFEDVVLTATDVTQGAEVRWYLGNDETPVATGTTYVVTSENEGEVTVKAKAFLGDCESDFKEHKVTFDKENCQGNLSNDIIINFTHPDKDETNKNCQYWGFGKLDYKINETSQSINLGNETAGTKTITIENIVASKITDVKFTAHYQFNSCNCEAYTTTIELEKGYEYDVTIEEGDGSGQQSSGSAEKTLVIERSVSLSTQPPLSAPAVKTVSATSVEGVVNFVGRVIKTGCAADANIWVGYQYKKKDDVWPTTGITEGTGEKQLVSLGNNKGKIDFSKTIEGLGDGDYHFRAYVINGYGRSSDANNYDQGVYYGIDIPVKVSTKKYPIENLQVKYANDRGEVLQDQNVTYCVRDDAYIKLIYDGSRLKPEDDVINISSTLENTFTLVEGEADLYTFVVKGNETITINAKNKENTDNPTAELTINTYAVPVIPSIDIDETTICSDNQKGAKITVSNPQVGMTYQVYKILGESEPTTHGAAKKYSEGVGVLEFNSMKEAGTYYVRAYNEQCPNAIAQSLDEILTVIDAAATSISISPKSKTVNPWVPVTFTVTKRGNYDYTFSCKEKEGENDVTSNMVINKSGDTYVVKFPKPDGVSAATNLDGQVTFADKKYIVEVKLNADVQCGTFDDESEVTLEPVNEICK